MNESNPSDDALAELLTLTVEVNEWGTTVYRNQHGQLHRTLGPAVIFSYGDAWWYQNGKRHRENGPAIEYTDGTIKWYLNGKRLTEQEYNERIKSIR